MLPAYQPVTELVELTTQLQKELYLGIISQREDGTVTIPRKRVTPKSMEYIDKIFNDSLMTIDAIQRIAWMQSKSRMIRMSRLTLTEPKQKITELLPLTHIRIYTKKGYSLYLAHISLGYEVICRRHIRNEAEILQQIESSLGIGSKNNS